MSINIGIFLVVGIAIIAAVVVFFILKFSTNGGSDIGKQLAKWDEARDKAKEERDERIKEVEESTGSDLAAFSNKHLDNYRRGRK